jgi:hypothetical protein
VTSRRQRLSGARFSAGSLQIAQVPAQAGIIRVAFSRRRQRPVAQAVRLCHTAARSNGAIWRHHTFQMAQRMDCGGAHPRGKLGEFGKRAEGQNQLKYRKQETTAGGPAACRIRQED